MITVVGIGADGWPGLAPASRRAIASAQVLVGSRRQLDLVPDPIPDGDGPGAPARVLLPSPLLPNLPPLLESLGDREICVLASGDPMFYGIGSTLVRLLGADQVRVLVPALLGQEVPEVTVVPYFWSDQYDVKIQIAGVLAPGVVERTELDTGDSLIRSFTVGGRLVGVVGWNAAKALIPYRRELDFTPVSA